MSVGFLQGVSSGGGAPGTSTMGRSVAAGLSMAILEHLLKLKHDRSGGSQSAGGSNQLGNSPLFVDIG